MTDSFEEYQHPPAESKPPAGRYDKLHAAGMATRFVEGTSGNPSGRPKRRQSRVSIKELAERFSKGSGRARDHGMG
jgi:hypothetical protein